MNIDIDLDFQNALAEYKNSLKDEDFIFCISSRRQTDSESTHLCHKGHATDLAKYMNPENIGIVLEENEDLADGLSVFASDVMGAVAIVLSSNKVLKELFLEDLKHYEETVTTY